MKNPDTNDGGHWSAEGLGGGGAEGFPRGWPWDVGRISIGAPPAPRTHTKTLFGFSMPPHARGRRTMRFSTSETGDNWSLHLLLDVLGLSFLPSHTCKVSMVVGLTPRPVTSASQTSMCLGVSRGAGRGCGSEGEVLLSADSDSGKQGGVPGSAFHLFLGDAHDAAR